MGVKVHCLHLGSTDLTSAAGKMITGMLNTFAEFERDLLIERLSGPRPGWTVLRQPGSTWVVSPCYLSNNGPNTGEEWRARVTPRPPCTCCLGCGNAYTSTVPSAQQT
jgi:DNA invertase Pin-like site-specific DNA recombinase